MKLTTYFNYLFFIVFAVAYITKAHVAKEKEKEKEELSYKLGTKNGPEHWGEIQPEWKECKLGKMQSPINLVDKTAQVLSNATAFNTSYKASNATLKNSGHDMMLRWPLGAGSIEINEVKYQLSQIHWHSPSEHTVNNKSFDMEAHLVHKTKDKRVAVIGLLYKIGDADPLLSKIERDMDKVNGEKDLEKVVGNINPKLLLSSIGSYYRYKGSFTSPPCTQNVTWTIVKKVRNASKEQVKLIRDATPEKKGNARPVQALNNRKVKLYKSKK